MSKLSMPSSKDMKARREAMNDSYRQLVAAKDRFRATAEAAGIDAKEDAVEQWFKGKREANKAASKAYRYLDDRPVPALLLVFGLGFFVTRLISRR